MPANPDREVQATAVVVAAGPGTRLKAGQPKAFVPLHGVPLVVHTLRALVKAPSISAAVVVIPPGDLVASRDLLDRHGPWRFPLSFVEGGADRQDSVWAGLCTVRHDGLVAIHDGARPFITPPIIELVIATAARHGAAIVAERATDTVKQVHPDGWIVSTPPRDRLWLAQTPQVFRTGILRTAYGQHTKERARTTDDATLVAHIGFRVHVVPGSPENRKITTPADLQWAEWLLERSPR